MTASKKKNKYKYHVVAFSARSGRGLSRKKRLKEALIILERKKKIAFAVVQYLMDTATLQLTTGLSETADTQRG